MVIEVNEIQKKVVLLQDTVKGREELDKKLFQWASINF